MVMRVFSGLGALKQYGKTPWAQPPLKRSHNRPPLSDRYAGRTAPAAAAATERTAAKGPSPPPCRNTRPCLKTAATSSPADWVRSRAWRSSRWPWVRRAERSCSRGRGGPAFPRSGVCLCPDAGRRRPRRGRRDRRRRKNR